MNTKQHKFVLLCPVYNERKNIENFVKQLQKINYNLSLFEVYFITTEREKQLIEPNTITKLKQHKFSDNFFVFHYPETEGYKAEQLNYAYQKITEKYDGKTEELYFLLLDADSSIHKNFLHYINEQIDDSCDVYQQPTVWFKNFNVLSCLSIVKSFPFLQTYFSVAYEIPMIEQIFNPFRIRYFIGHGLTIKGTLLKKFGGFPCWVEDTRFGRLCSYCGIKSRIIPYFGNVESAKNFKVLVKQLAVWFWGTNLFLMDFRQALKYCSTGCFFRNIFYTIYAFFKSIRWLNEGLIHFVLIIYALVYGRKLLLYGCLVSLIFRTIIPSLLVARHLRFFNINHIKNKNTIFPILLSPIVYLFDFLGTYLGLIKIIYFYVSKKFNLYKTER